MIHPQALAHFRDLAKEVSAEHADKDKLERLEILLLAALDCAYAAAEKNRFLLSRVQRGSVITELEQTVAWQRVAINELHEDRRLLLTVIEDAACMPPLFTYCRRAAMTLPDGLVTSHACER